MPIYGIARDDATYGALNLLFKLGVVTAFVDARPIVFKIAGQDWHMGNYKLVVQ